MKSLATGLFSLALFFHTNAFAAPTSVTRDNVSPASAYNRVMLGFSGGLATTGGGYGGTFLVGVSLPVAHSSPVRLGLDSGVMFGGGVGLPILLSVLYQIGQNSTVTPYLGGAVGPVIGLSRGTREIFDTKVPDVAIGDGIKLGIFLRPGLNFRMTELLGINIEAPIGGLTGIFYICPTVGVTLKV